MPTLAGGLCAIALAQGQPEHAARLYAGTDVICEIIARRYGPDKQRAYDRDVARCRALLTGDAFALTWEAGTQALPNPLVADALWGEV